MFGESTTPTPYAVRCFSSGCNGGNLIYLTPQEYSAQLSKPGARWECPRCGQTASWDDANYDARTDPDAPSELTEEPEDPETEALLDELFGPRKPKA